MKNRYYILIALLTMTFVSCNEEVLYDGPCKVRFVASVQDEVSVTRADADEYTALPYSSDFNAGLYVSYGETAEGYPMSWDNNSSTLSANLWLETGDYNFYGYAPQQNGAEFDNDNKILTIPNVPALYDKDLLVIRPSAVEVTSDDLLSGSKSVPLQMDHLSAKITPCFYLNSEYAKMRDIKIKTVEFFFEEATTYQAEVAYTDDPYTVTWTSDNANSECTVTAFSATNPTNLTNAATAHGHCYIVPAQSTETLKMRVTYDVYDKKGTLTREGAVAENQIKKLSQQSLVAGTNYNLMIQIVPTYLYVLSDNDHESLVIPNN